MLTLLDYLKPQIVDQLAQNGTILEAPSFALISVQYLNSALGATEVSICKVRIADQNVHWYMFCLVLHRPPSSTLPVEDYEVLSIEYNDLQV